MPYASHICNTYMKVVKKKKKKRPTDRPYFCRHITGNSGYCFVSLINELINSRVTFQYLIYFLAVGSSDSTDQGPIS